MPDMMPPAGTSPAVEGTQGFWASRSFSSEEPSLAMSVVAKANFSLLMVSFASTPSTWSSTSMPMAAHSGPSCAKILASAAKPGIIARGPPIGPPGAAPSPNSLRRSSTAAFISSR